MNKDKERKAQIEMVVEHALECAVDAFGESLSCSFEEMGIEDDEEYMELFNEYNIVLHKDK